MLIADRQRVDEGLEFRIATGVSDFDRSLTGCQVTAPSLYEGNWLTAK
jgi:hypothetical protein